MTLGRAVTLIGGLTMVSRLLGFARDIAMAHILGAGPVAQAFVVAFKLPNFFRRLSAEGAFASAFVPLFAGELQSAGRASAERFAREAQAALLFVLLPFTAIMVAAMPWALRALAPGWHDEPETFALAVDFSRIAFPYLLFISLVSLYGGALNGLQKFGHAAAAPILLNLSLLGALLFLTPALPNGGYALSVGVFVAGVLQFVWLLLACRRAGLSFAPARPRWNDRMRRLWRLMLPAALGAGVFQVNSMLDVVWASFMPDGAIAFLYYADRLAQLPLGVVGTAIGTALLPLLAAQLRAGSNDAAMANQNRALEFGLLLALPAALALIALADPIVRVLFQRGEFDAAAAGRTADALAAFALGLPAFVAVKALAPGYYAREDATAPLWIALACIVAAAGANLAFLLLTDLHHVGIALATSLSGWLNAALLAGGLARRGHLRLDDRSRLRLPRILAASALMAAALFAAEPVLAVDRVGAGLARAAALAALCGAGAALYFAAGAAMGVVRLSEMRAMVRRERGLAAEPAAGPD